MGTKINMEMEMESHVQRPCGHKGRDMEEELENLKEDQRGDWPECGRATSHVA